MLNKHQTSARHKHLLRDYNDYHLWLYVFGGQVDVKGWNLTKQKMDIVDFLCHKLNKCKNIFYLFTSTNSKIHITAPPLPFDKVVVSPCQPVDIIWHWPTFGYTHAVCFGELLII